METIEAIIDSDRPRHDISIALLPHDTSVELVIGDSGPGWPGGTLDEVLLRTTKREGSGIGLCVVKTALENHRGDITIGPSPLGGVESCITLPRWTGGGAEGGHTCAQVLASVDVFDVRWGCRACPVG